jgi:hypothetical protein
MNLFQKTAKLKKGSLQREHASDVLTDAEWEKALGPDVDFKQMKQGELGDCYFLAALVAIAHNHKDIIRNMFRDGSLLTGDNPVYTTEWMINGRKSMVATNDKVPTNADTDEPWFAKGKKQAWWPTILEKAWAKIFGDYKTTESGKISEAFKAITQAPVEVVSHDTILERHGSQDEHWQKLLQWSQKKFPMGTSVSSRGNSIGIANGHAYALLEAYEHGGKHSRRLKIYNPHGSDGYNGVLANEKAMLVETVKSGNSNKYFGAPPPDSNDIAGDGSFSVTFEEFLHNFYEVRVAQVQKGYAVSDIVLSRETQSTVVLEFDMDSNKPFAVQLEWPSSRFLSNKCEIEPAFLVEVAKADSLESSKVMMTKIPHMTNARASMPGGAGKYVVFVNANFPLAKDWLKDFVVNVYGPPTKLVQSPKYSKPWDLFLEMQGLCRTMLVPKTGKDRRGAAEYTFDESKTVKGVPIFFGKEAYESYQVIYWYARENQWRLISSLEKAEAGSHYPDFDGIPGWSCSANLLQHDPLAEEASSEKPLAVEKKRHTETTVEMADIESNDEDLGGESCGKMVERLSSLGNGRSIASSGTDPEFPEDQQSIGSAECGDSAQGISEDCGKYNSWQSMAVLRERYAAGKVLEAQCEKDCSAKECTPKKLVNSAGEDSCNVDFSYCSVPFVYRNDAGKHYSTLSDQGYNLEADVCTDDSYKVTDS